MKHFQHVEYNVKLSKWSQGKMKNGTGSFPKWQQFMKTFQQSYLPGLSDSQRLGSKFVLLLQNIASSQYLLWRITLCQTSLITKSQSSRAPLGHWAVIKEKRHECWLCFYLLALLPLSHTLQNLSAAAGLPFFTLWWYFASPLCSGALKVYLFIFLMYLHSRSTTAVFSSRIGV